MQSVTEGSTLSQGYDDAGNLISDGVHSYQYDAAGRIAKVDAGTANEASYFYDANNCRVKKVLGTGGSAVTTNYIWEGGAVIAEYSNGSPQGSGGTRYYHPDRLSTRMITDGNSGVGFGSVLGTQDHLPFGEDAGVVGESEKHRFTSYERDSEIGSDYAVNRQHQFATGRFTRPDPIGGSVGAPQTLNRYSYGLNDPVSSIDPLGLKTCYIDGIEQDCSIAWSLVRSGTGVDVGEAARQRYDPVLRQWLMLRAFGDGSVGYGTLGYVPGDRRVWAGLPEIVEPPPGITIDQYIAYLARFAQNASGYFQRTPSYQVPKGYQTPGYKRGRTTASLSFGTGLSYSINVTTDDYGLVRRSVRVWNW
jgi:RHS repeat-associated protein